MTAEAFLNFTTIGIVIGGFLAFALSIAGGIFFVKLFNLFTKKKINPLIGATGLSAVPMASRVANEIALKYDQEPCASILHGQQHLRRYRFCRSRRRIDLVLRIISNTDYI